MTDHEPDHAERVRIRFERLMLVGGGVTLGAALAWLMFHVHDDRYESTALALSLIGLVATVIGFGGAGRPS